MEFKLAFEPDLESPEAIWPRAYAHESEQKAKEIMVIVAGTVEVGPDERDAFIGGRIDQMHTTRTEPGCLEYTYSADPSDPARVMLIERWASQKDLDGYIAVALARPASPATDVKPKAVSIYVYDVTGERQLGG